MTRRFYDVVVLGRGIGALAAAAVLARRDFTVLVLGQGRLAPSYPVDDVAMPRRGFAMLAAATPSWRRVLNELAHTQGWKQLTRPTSPMLQVLWPRRRFDISPNMELFARELDRELPEVRRVVGELYDELAHVNSAADKAFEHDALWPPGSFWERRETERYAAMLPYARAEPDADLLRDFPKAHPFRQVVSASVAFGTHLATQPPPFAVARIHGSWTRGLPTLPEGADTLERLLVERIEATGGKCLLHERAESIVVRRSQAAGVVIDGEREPVGTSFVLSDLDGEGIASLTAGKGLHSRALREWPRITYPVGRFVVNVVAAREGVPAPLGPEVLLPMVGRGEGRRPRPAVWLQRRGLSGGRELLCAETLVPERGLDSLAEMRGIVLSAICAELPFLERHLLLVDSPHDGLPIWSWRDGALERRERWQVRGASARAEPMTPLVEVDPLGYLGLAGEPIRGPVERVLLVGPTVMPALGQEGELLAALGAARLVTRSDGQKLRTREDMWSKIEIG